MRPQFLLEAAVFWLRLKNPIGESEYLWSRAVVRLDAVDGGPWMSIGECEDILEVCATPRVDALSVVSDGQHPVVASDQVDDFRLKRVGVLVFVDQDMAEPVLKISGSLG